MKCFYQILSVLFICTQSTICNSAFINKVDDINLNITKIQLTHNQYMAKIQDFLNSNHQSNVNSNEQVIGLLVQFDWKADPKDANPPQPISLFLQKDSNGTSFFQEIDKSKLTYHNDRKLFTIQQNFSIQDCISSKSTITKLPKILQEFTNLMCAKIENNKTVDFSIMTEFADVQWLQVQNLYETSIIPNIIDASIGVSFTSILYKENVNDNLSSPSNIDPSFRNIHAIHSMLFLYHYIGDPVSEVNNIFARYRLTPSIINLSILDIKSRNYLQDKLDRIDNTSDAQITFSDKLLVAHLQSFQSTIQFIFKLK